MKKLISLVVALVVTVSAYAFDFTGKTFTGSMTIDGDKVTVSYRFKANNRVTATIKIGSRSQSVNGYWEVSGDYINLSTSADMLYLMIDEEDGKVVLVDSDDYGNTLVLHQAATSSTASGKKSGSKKRR